MRRAPHRPNADSHHKRGKIVRAYADPAPRTRPRKIGLKEVACPEGCAIGQPCMSSKGKVLTAGHASRRRMAGRLDNERREAEGTFVAQPYPERTPGPREDPNGPLCETCGLHVQTFPDPKTERTLLVVHTKHGFAPSGVNRACPGSRQEVCDGEPS
jgi:hypothetical protein